MSWTQTRSSSRTPLPAQPNHMIKDEFIALDRGLLKHPSTVISWRCLTAAPASDASAIHGRLDARVALLQSPILPAAVLLYPGKELFRNLPVDKPHTCNLEPFKPETPKIALYVVLAQGRLTLQVVWRDMKLQCLLLKYGQFISKPCVSPQVFYGSRRLTRCVLGSEAFRTMEQTWESQSGGALESDDTVKTK